MPEGLPVTKRRPIPIANIHKIQQKCRDQDDERRWIIALLSDTGMKLGEAIGLLKADTNLEAQILVATNHHKTDPRFRMSYY